MRFRDREDAGKALARMLLPYAGRPDVLVLALPRGGVPVGYEVAETLRAPLDVYLVRKLGVPGHEELAMGAIASGGVRVLNSDIIEAFHIPESVIDRVAAGEMREMERRQQAYRDGRPPANPAGRVVILVDDGLATGATMRAALVALRAEHPSEVVAAVPVAPEATCNELYAYADEVICVETPEPFYGVGMWYDDFTPTSDAEVQELLARAARENGEPPVYPFGPYEPGAFPPRAL